MPIEEPRKRISIYAWAVLGFTVLVILWGAYVRATGSGAGCGRHWPLCNGEVFPRSPRVETLVEFSHRLSSGLAFTLVVVLLVLVMRNFPKGHPARTGAGLSMLFMILEAGIGAGLVLFELVADNPSILRGTSVMLHLVNTFLLLGSLTLTARWISGAPAIKLDRLGKNWMLLIGLSGMILLGMSGAIAALGDTLFPSESLIEGLLEDVSPDSHIFLQLRIYHPVIAIIVGGYLFTLVSILSGTHPHRIPRRLAYALPGLIATQLLAGALNVVLLAPVWLQMIHLLLADLIWILLVTFTARLSEGVSIEDGTRVPRSSRAYP